MRHLKVLSIGPAVTVQDQGRPGYISKGLAQGGAADTRALAEGAALLGQLPECAALEMAGYGGRFQAVGDLRIALTGAPMKARLDGAPLVWNASHLVRHGQTLEIGAVLQGVYGYLHLGGGFESELLLGARAVHVSCGLGRRIRPDDVLHAGTDKGQAVGMALPADPRFAGGQIRIVESFQSHRFNAETRTRFAQTTFKRGQRANRMGVELLSEGAGFTAKDQLNILSEVIVPGDVQMTGDGRPFVLMRECQTTGGYPRIGTVLPCDLPKVAQAGLNCSVTFKWVSLEEGLAIEARHAQELDRLPSLCEPLLRDPREMQDLLAYQLVSGVFSASDDPFPHS